MGGLKLYLIHYDHQAYYVEAENLVNAVGKWKEYVKLDWKEDYDGTEEPESIALVHEAAVIR